jgi:hypothetical protein
MSEATSGIFPRGEIPDVAALMRATCSGLAFRTVWTFMLSQIANINFSRDDFSVGTKGDVKKFHRAQRVW